MYVGVGVGVLGVLGVWSRSQDLTSACWRHGRATGRGVDWRTGRHHGRHPEYRGHHLSLLGGEVRLSVLLAEQVSDTKSVTV